MQYQHIDLRIKGFYKIASLNRKWEAIMGINAQQKLDTLEFWHKHDLNAARDAFKVSLLALYRWRQDLACASGIVAARQAKLILCRQAAIQI